MRKHYDIIIAFILAAALMFLASCKQSRSVEAQTDAVSVQTVHVEDSLHTDLSFLFDRLDMWYYDSVDVDTQHALSSLKLVKHMAIQGGRFTEKKTETKLKQSSDSLTLRSQEVIHPVNVPPKLPKSIALAVIFFIVFIIIASRTHE